MRFLILFGVTAPILLLTLLTVSARLDPSQATDIFDVMGITSAKANSYAPPPPAAKTEKDDLFGRLRSRPLR